MHASKPIGFAICLTSLILQSCQTIPGPGQITPSVCRAFGVDVPDCTERTGIVVEELSGFRTLGGVRKECGEPPGADDPSRMAVAYSGCTHALEGHWFPSLTRQYIAVWAGRCSEIHERCHAVFEQSRHTVAFNLRWMQGDKLAACPG